MPRPYNRKPKETKEEKHHVEKKEESQEVVLEQVKQHAPVDSVIPANSKPHAAPHHDPHVAESRKSLEHPLQPGQKFFETPEGEIIIGESSKDQIWSRHMNKGKGGWANPKR